MIFAKTSQTAARLSRPALIVALAGALAVTGCANMDQTQQGTAKGAGAFGLTALRPSRSGAERAGRLALATAAAGCAAAITVARSVPRGGWWVGPLTVGSMVGGAALPLLGLALAGRRGEQRRDLAEEAGR